MKTRKRFNKRRAYIIRILANLSRNGWAHATPADYEPLELELSQLER